uniref:Uncharacterized protein n=1 Tax=Timema poppense TaxID=170557 RepID=A0A7R9DE81_TIMPO|nr:unnamed protein product [Timema poppensis]
MCHFLEVNPGVSSAFVSCEADRINYRGRKKRDLASRERTPSAWPLRSSYWWVCDHVSNHDLEQHLEHATRLLLDEGGDSLDSTSASKTVNGWTDDRPTLTEDMADEEPISEEDVEPKRWHARVNVAIMSFLACWINYMLRVNMTLAIVAMVPFKESAQSDPICGAHPTKSSSNTSREPPDHGPRYDWSNDIQYSILGSYFWGNVLTAFPGGLLSDMFGGTRVILYTTLLTGAATCFLPLFAQIHWGLVLASRFLIGFFGPVSILLMKESQCLNLKKLVLQPQLFSNKQACLAWHIHLTIAFLHPELTSTQGACWPALHSLFSKWAPPLEKGKFVWSLFGGIFGTIISLPLGGVIIEDLGWPAFFLLSGGLAIVWCLAWWYLIRDTPNQHPRITKKERDYINSSIAGVGGGQKRKFPAKQAFTSFRFWVLIISHTGSLAGLIFLQSLAPKYMNDVLGYNIREYRQTDIQADRHTDRQTYRHTDIQTYRQTDRQRDKRKWKNNLFRFGGGWERGVVMKHRNSSKSRLTSGGLSSLPYVARLLLGLVFSLVADWLLAKGKMTTWGIRRWFTIPSHLIPGLLLVSIGFTGCNPAFSVALMTIGLGMNGASVVTNLINQHDLAPNFAEKLVSYLKPDQIKIPLQCHSNDEWLKQVSHKGVFPYDCINSFERCSTTELSRSHPVPRDILPPYLRHSLYWTCGNHQLHMSDQ